MLFVRDKGQLCNNILQYGHVYAWARERGRKTMSLRFAYKYQYFRICHTKYHSFLVYVLVKYAAKLNLIKRIGFWLPEDEGNQHLESMMHQSKNAVVEGWYVRFYDLFLKYKSEIINLFTFDDNISSKANRLTSHVAEDAIRLGVHIRRGDYKKFHRGDYFFDDDVYISYIKSFIQSHNDNKVIVFICGNDPNLDRDYYRNQLSETEIVFPGGNPGEDLCLLSECHFLIGPPSTFSLVASMYHNIPLLWMYSSDSNSVNNPTKWGYFDKLFKEII